VLRYALLLLAACADAPVESTAPAPLVGVDGSHDQADRNCNIVLRGLERVSTGSGFLTNGSSWVWQGTIEISEAAAADGLVPSVIYQSGTATWFTASATPSSAAATPGYARFDIRIDHDLPGPSTTASDVQVVPLIAMPEGGRLFDHNRNPGDLDNYVMTSPDYAVWGDGSVCVPSSGSQHAQLVFAADWSEHREGVLAPGGEVTVAYAQSRLVQCYDEQGGHLLWDITAHVRFDPAGELREFSVRDAAVTIPVPPDTRSAVLWFEATSAAGCHMWDSNYGANYTFDAATPPAWVGLAQTLITRDDSGDICGGASASSGFSFDTWARQRATITNLCFQVYQPGMTDHDDPDLWQKLDASLHWRGTGQDWRITPVDFDRRVGNNARYAQSWRELDPFRAFHCPDVPTTTSCDTVSALVEYYIVVNGYEVRPEPGAAFSGTFSDYANDPWRAANCP
jgi:Family of unknown function (DUF6209)